MFRNTKKKIKKEHHNKTTTKKNVKLTLASDNMPCNEIMMPISRFEKIYSKDELLKMNTNWKNDTNSFLNFYKNKYNIKPNNDYYNHINSTWISKIEAFKSNTYITKVDTFRLIQDKVFNEIHDIYDNLIDVNSTRKDVVNMKQFYNSAKALITVEQCNKYINEFITYLDYLRNQPIKNNLWKLLAYISKNKLISSDAPLFHNMVPNEKDTKKYAIHIVSITLPSYSNISMYLEPENPKYKTLYDEYTSYLQTTFNVTGNDKLKATDAHEVIKDILLCYSTTNFNSSTEYNKVYKDESLEKYRFNFEEYCKELGFTTIPDYFISSNLDYLKNVSELMLREWKSEKWRAFWIRVFIKQIVRFTKEFKPAADNFYLKYLKGQDYDFSDDIRAIRLTLLPYNKLLSDLYVKKYNDPTLINYTNFMVSDLKMVFEKMLTENKWMEATTKKKALLKLEKLKVVVGENLDTDDDPDLNYVNYDIWSNLLNYNEWKHKQFLNLHDKDVMNLPIIKWSEYPFEYAGYQVFTVNANYNSTTNAVYIPVAYIQEPFISVKNHGSLDYNLANIGFTIAHELTHAFDNIGSNYDHDGNLNEWWSASDKKKYKMIQENVKKHYDYFTKKDGVTIELDLSLRENISDINSITICMRYIMDFLNDSGLGLTSMYEVIEDFFINYTIAMRQTIQSKAANYYYLIDPHPPTKYRVNVPLSRCELFTAFSSVKKGDGMYFSPVMPIF